MGPKRNKKKRRDLIKKRKEKERDKNRLRRKWPCHVMMDNVPQL